MDCLFQVGRISGGFVEERESHCIMRVRNGKPLAFPEEPSRGRQKSFAEHHRSDCERTEQRLAVIEGFCSAAKLACIETLVIVRGFPVAIEPFREAGHGRFHFRDLCFFHEADLAAEELRLIGKGFEVVDRLQR